MTYYKVVRIDPRTHHRTSCIMRERALGRVIYRPGLWVGRRWRCGPLCVFDSWWTADEFARHEIFGRRYEIWRVQIKRSRSPGAWAWRKPRFQQSGFRHTRSSFPPGTVLAHKVKLIERVYPAQEAKA